MEELTIIEYDKKFIPVYKTEKGTEVIRGSELHNGLNVEKAFSTWIKKQLENILICEQKHKQIIINLINKYVDL